MLYLITGTNGAGKTLNTLKWVRERQLKENRPVAHNGRFDPIPGGELDSWKKIDFKDWQNEPDGTIFLVDECHNDLPKAAPSAKPPEYIRMLAEHRKRGFDFYLISQHPLNVDSFVRRLIGSPGWHRHLKRTFGGDLVSVIEWSSVNDKCEKDGSGKSGTVTMTPFPKDVFTWYKSASLHTGKKKIPKTVWMLLAMLVLIPLLLWGAYSRMQSNITKHIPENAVPGQTQSAPGGNASPNYNRAPAAVMTANEYLQSRTARLPDFPHTAPAYDQLTQPRDVPYPAACVAMANTCKCYSQQATVLRVSADICAQIVKNGFFVDWQEPPRPEREKPRTVMVSSQPDERVQAAQVVRSVPVPDNLPDSQPQPTWSEALALRNAQVKSSMVNR